MDQHGRVSILLVDDRPDKVLAIEAVLEELGQNIVCAHSGRDALRCVLQREFAVILLDVNMPDMDGFETAALIRQRVATKHTPIIFVTAYADEMQLARGYSLGAVDYILAPVVPEVLRSKVGVFVDLYRKSALLRRQAELQQQRAAQLQKLAAASLAINGARSLQSLLKVAAEWARDIIGSHQSITLFVPDPGIPFGSRQIEAVGSFSEKYAAWRTRRLKLEACAQTEVAKGRRAIRLTEDELHNHPDWQIVQCLDVPPIHGMLAAPLVSSEDRSMGVIYLAEKNDGTFSEDDDAILTQLAQMTSVAIENSLYAEEREANRIKDEFLATLSHELRTPLNAILGWTQLLATHQLDEEVSHGLEVIERNARAQTKLIEDLLDVSRITTGKLRLNVKPIAFGPVVEAAADAVRPAAAAKNITLDLDLAPDAAGEQIPGDADRLQQVVWNLLANAVKFTPKGGRVTAGLRREENVVRLRVTDTGRGIAPEFLPFVFDRFRQADSTSTRAHGGLGIGLTIVRHIVELHGGSVSAESGGEGAGATFIVDLPLAPAPAATAPAVQPAAGANGDGASRASGTMPADAVAAPGANPSGANGGLVPAAVLDRIRPRSSELDGIHVLLVDDEPDAREVVSTMLRRAGAQVSAAGSVREAIEAFERLRPHVLLSDIAMPDRDGYELIRLVREMPASQGGQTPAVALTAYAREEDRFRALTAGFQAHLTKPVAPPELVNVVAHVSTMGSPRVSA